MIHSSSSSLPFYGSCLSFHISSLRAPVASVQFLLSTTEVAPSGGQNDVVSLVERRQPGDLCMYVCVRACMCSPVDGVWSEWAAWSNCKHPYKDTNIQCKTIRGLQRRDRSCLRPLHNGRICNGTELLETRRCYDISGCQREDSTRTQPRAHSHTHTCRLS